MPRYAFSRAASQSGRHDVHVIMGFVGKSATDAFNRFAKSIGYIETLEPCVISYSIAVGLGANIYPSGRTIHPKAHGTADVAVSFFATPGHRGQSVRIDPPESVTVDVIPDADYAKLSPAAPVMKVILGKNFRKKHSHWHFDMKSSAGAVAENSNGTACHPYPPNQPPIP